MYLNIIRNSAIEFNSIIFNYVHNRLSKVMRTITVQLRLVFQISRMVFEIKFVLSKFSISVVEFKNSVFILCIKMIIYSM